MDVAAAAIPGVPGGAGAALKATRTAEKASLTVAKVTSKEVKNVKRQKTHQTYIKINKKTNKVYVGRTSGYDSPTQNVKNRDKNHHVTKLGFDKAILDRTSTNKDAIRGREQLGIESCGGARSQGGTSGNAINGISPKNPNVEKYRKACELEFGKEW